MIVAQHGDAAAVARLAAAVAESNPGYHLTAGVWDGEGELAPAAGGVRYLWLVDGSGVVLLPAGYRTQEGDGLPLPPCYGTDQLPVDVLAQLDTLRRALQAGAVYPQLRAPVAALCARQRQVAYVGDVAGDIWLLLESGLPPDAWAADAGARAALGSFVCRHADIGWSTKKETSWEPLCPGDQLITTPDAPLRVRGRFRFWSIEDAGRSETACSVARRLRHLRDTAGGCSPGFDAFRRLNLTWRPPAAVQGRVAAALGMPGPGTGDRATRVRDLPPVAGSEQTLGPPDGDADEPNRLNSHVLHIEAAQSRTHYHPVESIGGGRAQSEFYFVLDPAAYGLRAPAGAVPRLYTFPDVADWGRYEVTELAPRVAAFMPPGTGHRGMDVFVNVVTIPGFKPGNEVYVDVDIRRATNGAAPHNPAAA